MKKQFLADKADEAHAVKTYGKRQQQLPQHASTFAEMQGDEKDHFRKLTHILSGLKKAGR